MALEVLSCGRMHQVKMSCEPPNNEQAHQGCRVNDHVPRTCFALTQGLPDVITQWQHAECNTIQTQKRDGEPTTNCARAFSQELNRQCEVFVAQHACPLCTGRTQRLSTVTWWRPCAMWMLHERKQILRLESLAARMDTVADCKQLLLV